MFCERLVPSLFQVGILRLNWVDFGVPSAFKAILNFYCLQDFRFYACKGLGGGEGRI